ncbi:hypothetical protein L7F22_028102 [Adiantum nelumboides]|nr:hypothetical protein [Adiantum nelumboides]
MAISRYLMNAAKTSSTVSRSQGAPALSRPAPTSRIRIIPPEEKPGQEALNVPRPLSSLSSNSIESKADNKRWPVSTARIKIIPFEEQVGQEVLNMPRSFCWTSIESKPAPQGQESDDILQKSCDNIVAISAAASPMASVQQKAAHAQMVAVNHGTHSQVTYLPVNHLQPDDKNWFHSGAPTIIVTNGNNIGSSDNIVSIMHPAYTPVVGTSEPHQYMSSGAACKPVASLAPRVRVRQAIPVSSAPPRTSERKDQGSDSKQAAAALQGLSNLKL